MSLRDLIAAADDITREIVDVPEWGVKLELRSASGADRALLLKQTVNADGEPDADAWPLLWAYALVVSAYDPETGQRAFTFDDVPMLQTKQAGVLTRLGNRCLELSGLTPDAVEGAKKSAPDAS